MGGFNSYPSLAAGYPCGVLTSWYFQPAPCGGNREWQCLLWGAVRMCWNSDCKGDAHRAPKASTVEGTPAQPRTDSTDANSITLILDIVNSFSGFRSHIVMTPNLDLQIRGVERQKINVQISVLPFLVQAVISCLLCIPQELTQLKFIIAPARRLSRWGECCPIHQKSFRFNPQSGRLPRLQV